MDEKFQTRENNCLSKDSLISPDPRAGGEPLDSAGRQRNVALKPLAEGEPAVSVIIPVYNAEPYLKDCLQSILSQSLDDIEIICINDGSSDASEEIIDCFAEKDSRIIKINQKNSGAGAARNAGLKLARGKYLSFLDADDFFEPVMLEKAFDKIEKDKAEIAVFKSDQYYTKTSEYKEMPWTIAEDKIPSSMPFDHRQMKGNIFRVFVGWAWDKLFLREFVEKKGLKFQEQRTTNDLLFVFSAVALASKITVLDEVLIHQRRDSLDSVSKSRENTWFCFHDALTALYGRMKEDGLYEELERDLINYSVHSAMWNMDTLAEPAKTKLKKKLKEDWNEELGIKGKPLSYFYNKREYLGYMAELYIGGRLIEKLKRRRQ